MKYWFDTEFNEDGTTIDLISFGIVAEDGRELYLCNQDAALHRVNPWVREHVLPHLPPPGAPEWQPRQVIRDRLTEFVLEGVTKPEFWAYYADYDWVALCQLYGQMVHLPLWFPKFCMDLKQWSVMVGSPEHPKQEGEEHHAVDAGRVAVFCGLNPSTAGAATPDQTITKEIGFAKRLRCCELLKVNLFPWISTDPAGLDRPEATLDVRDGVLRDVVELGVSGLFVCIAAWGSHPKATPERIAEVSRLLPGPLHCFGRTKDGAPRHTARIAYATPLEPWR